MNEARKYEKELALNRAACRMRSTVAQIQETWAELRRDLSKAIAAGKIVRAQGRDEDRLERALVAAQRAATRVRSDVLPPAGKPRERKP